MTVRDVCHRPSKLGSPLVQVLQGMETFHEIWNQRGYTGQATDCLQCFRYLKTDSEVKDLSFSESWTHLYLLVQTSLGLQFLRLLLLPPAPRETVVPERGKEGYNTWRFQCVCLGLTCSWALMDVIWSGSRRATRPWRFNTAD